MYYGHKTKFLWEEAIGSQEAVIALHQLTEAARACKARLEAKFGEKLLTAFSWFDLLRWKSACCLRSDDQNMAVPNLCHTSLRLCISGIMLIFNCKLFVCAEGPFGSWRWDQLPDAHLMRRVFIAQTLLQRLLSCSGVTLNPKGIGFCGLGFRVQHDA